MPIGIEKDIFSENEIVQNQIESIFDYLEFN